MGQTRPAWATLFLCLSALFLCVFGGTDKSIFISFQGEQTKPLNNVYRYSMNGTHVGTLISNDSGLSQLRGITVDGDCVLICNAGKDDYKIVSVSLRGGVPSLFATTNIRHPYGIVVRNQVVYVSNQNTGCISLFSLLTGQPVGTGVFAVVPNPRGISLGPNGDLYAASNSFNQIISYNSYGEKLKTFPIEAPTGVAFAVQRNLVLASSNSPTDPAVLAFDPSTGRLVQTFRTPHVGFAHPAGLTVDEDDQTLYVLGQTHRALFRWNLTDGKYGGKVIDLLPDFPESVIIAALS